MPVDRRIQLRSARRLVAPFTSAVAVGLVLAGCSPGDVQLNGKVFDLVGSATGASAQQGEVKVAQRPGIVVPPNLQNLPTPGAQTPQQADIGGIVDHDNKQVVDNTQLKAQQAEYCKVHYDQAKQRGDQNADLAEGPMGPCRPSAMSLIDFGGLGFNQDKK